MRVISIRQPFASLIACGEKTIELRSWPTKYRGPILVISGAKPWKPKWESPEPLGKTICLVELFECRLANKKDADAACFEPPKNWFSWILKNPQPVKNIPIKGRLGLYSPDDFLQKFLETQTAAL